MRIFEAVLILVNLLSLAVSFKKQRKAVWRRAAVANLSVFLLHAIWEGLRYQMVFSYIFVVLFVILAIAKTNDNFYKAKPPKALKVIALSLVFLSLAFTSFLTYALPVFTLPEPTAAMRWAFSISILSMKTARTLSWIDQRKSGN